MLFSNIKALCDERRISITDLEEGAEIARGTIYKWKTVEPSVSKVKRVADFLGVSVDYLLLPGAEAEAEEVVP